MNNVSQRPRTIHALLDQHFPPDRYSQEDRIGVLLFFMRTQGLVELTWSSVLRKKEAPAGLLHDLLNGRTDALRSAAGRQHGHAFPQVLLNTKEGERLAFSAAELRSAFRKEYERLRRNIDQRTPMGAADLRERGYQLTGQRSQEPVDELCDPRRVHSFPDLVRALDALRVAHGTPPWRTMAKLSEKKTGGLGDHLHQTRSHSALRRLVEPRARPTLVSVLAFVRGCGVLSPADAQEWIRAHARAVMSAKPRRPG
ncbi:MULTISPECIES: hypothetical protein [unclassified Nocardiopsis]|uniref:hypothetical protein n=1 Tax=unclassified Nocardiopsis TaxID=2649073 RepID=UPI001356B3B3|nr:MULTISPECIES: hypothetical protein [unclassified Nocardiopsis]